MNLIDDDTATAADISEELTFLIASATTDAQRKRAIGLFRRFARQVEREAFRRGRESVSPPVHVLSRHEGTAVGIAPDQAPAPATDQAASRIPPVSWQD